MSNKIVGICVFQVVVDEAQLNYFSISQNFRRIGCGSYLMHYLIKQCRELNLRKISSNKKGKNPSDFWNDIPRDVDVWIDSHPMWQLTGLWPLASGL